MQYPEIQFYRGSLVRLASGQLKQVEDLSSDDFLESARLSAGPAPATTQTRQRANTCNTDQRTTRFDFGALPGRDRHRAGAGGSSGTLDENNNSVFNSPEPTSSTFDDSPRMEMDEFEVDEEVALDQRRAREPRGRREEDEEEEIDVELDVVSHDDQSQSVLRAQLGAGNRSQREGAHSPTERCGLNLTSQSVSLRNLQVEMNGQAANSHQYLDCSSGGRLGLSSRRPSANSELDHGEDQEFYIDSSVVRDFLEVAPIQPQATLSSGQQPHLAPSSPASSTGSPGGRNHQRQHQNYNQGPGLALSSEFRRTPSCSSSSPSSPPVVISQSASSSPTVLVKFFLESSRSVAFIEVPIEHPFFVLHRGWSSWNPQRTSEKFGLKCRKLKIGDTCISLIRRRRKGVPSFQQESDNCNIMFSSIKINE